jgi:CRP-like cAMP-binding protein
MRERPGAQPLPLDRPPAFADRFEPGPPRAVAAPVVDLGRVGTRRRYERGETALAQGSAFRALFVVERGLFRESAVSNDGRWFVHGLLGPGAVFGSVAVAGATTTVRAATRAEATSLRPEDFASLLARRSDAAWALIAGMEERARRGRAAAEDLAWLDVPARIRRRLAELALEHGRPVGDGVRIDAAITQEELGAMIGATRETVNRALVPLIAAGHIRVDRRRWVVRPSIFDGAADDGST